MALSSPGDLPWRFAQMHECACCPGDIAAPLRRSRLTSYASGVFFTLAPDPALLADLLRGLFYLPARPRLQRFLTHASHFVYDSQFRSVRLPQIASLLFHPQRLGAYCLTPHQFEPPPFLPHARCHRPLSRAALRVDLGVTL